VAKIVQKTATLQSLQTGQLTKDQVYRLWKCAIKDDDRLADALIQKIYDGMIAFDPKRAETVIRLIVDRHEAAEPAFQDLLRDIEVSAVLSAGITSAGDAQNMRLIRRTQRFELPDICTFEYRDCGVVSFRRIRAAKTQRFANPGGDE
jgi:hypothetical protein